MKRTFITLFTVISIIVIIFLVQYSIKCNTQEKKNANENSEAEILWIENFGTKEPQYKMVISKFKENTQYFIDLQKYYDSIAYQSILTEGILKNDEVEIEGISYSIKLSDEVIKLCKKAESQEVSYANVEADVEKYVGYCHEISIQVNRASGELEMICIDVTNPEEKETVFLVWSKEEETDTNGNVEILENNWKLVFYGAI